MKSLFLLFLLFESLISHTLSAPTCTQTLADADKDASGGLSLSEYRSFLEQEAAKNDFVIMATAITDPESPIGHLFTMLAGDGAPVAGEIDITGASATDRSIVPARQQAILELICVKSKALIHEISSYAPSDRQQKDYIPNNPFLGENNQHQDTHVETRQFKGLEVFGVQLFPNQGGICSKELSILTSAVSAECPDYLSVCRNQQSTGDSFNDTIPECTDLEIKFCEKLSFLEAPGCCLSNVIPQMYDFMLCSLRETKGIERADCSRRYCAQAMPPLPIGMELDIFGNNPLNVPHCTNGLTEIISCMEEHCTNFLQSCRDPMASPDANISLAIGNSIPDTCSEIGAAVCNAFADLPESCCLSQCFFEFLYQAQCIVHAAVPGKMGKLMCFPFPDCYVDLLVESELRYPITIATLDIIQSYEFDFFGTIMNKEVVTSECTEVANYASTCIEEDCPSLLVSCKREFFSFPWSFGPEADSFFLNPQSYPFPSPAYFMVNSQAVDLIPANFGCANMTDAFCELLNFPDTCCLSKCTTQIYDLAACMVDYAIGNNSDLASSCPAPNCANLNETFSVTVSDNIMVSINSSFLISTLDEIKAAILKEDLQRDDSKYVKVLQEAYLNVVESVVDALSGGSNRRHLVGSSHTGFETNTRSRRMQEPPAKLDPRSVELYNFVDSPCDATAIEAVSKQGETTQNCISVFGKYSLLVDPQEDPMKVYNKVMAETTSSISSGKLQESLLSAADQFNVTGTFPFVIEGVSSEYDSSFVPINNNMTGFGKNVSVPLSTDLVATDDSDVTGTTSFPANGTLEPDANLSTVSPTNGSLIVLTMAPSNACLGKSMSVLLCMCFGVVCLVLSGI